MIIVRYYIIKFGLQCRVVSLQNVGQSGNGILKTIVGTIYFRHTSKRL